MLALKCTICGGELEVNEDLSVGTCMFCGSKIVIPKSLGKNGNKYNRAVFLRQSNQFDKAISLYEEILKEDNMDSEAHWGMVLSKFGIVHVTDPATGKKIPTCHRTQSESILSDPDYLAAIEYADYEAKSVIREEAEKINRIQMKIIENSQKEVPYDVFICYKETDDFGQRTEDSIIAQDLYYELTEKRKYKVFFARKTLERKLGSDYEPIIFAALRSAKVMVIIGTKPEYYNAVWVRNEWSRFRSMCKNEEKYIIPAYKYMSPYELPIELASIQSQDLSKIGAMQDLLDGIERIIKTRKAIDPIEDSKGMNSLERLLQNAQTYLNLENYKLAEEVYLTVSRSFPEDYRGWWGLIISKTENLQKVVLDEKLNLWYKYSKKLAKKEVFSENEKKYLVYLKAVSKVKSDKDIQEVKAFIASDNNNIKTYRESISNTEENLRLKKEDYELKTATIDIKISDCKKRLAAEKRSWTWGVILLIFGGIVGTIGILCLIFESNIANKIIEGALFGIPASFILIKVNYSLVLHGPQREQSELMNALDAKDREKKKYNSLRDEINISIADMNKKIDHIQMHISDCNKYIELGKESISEYWYSKDCHEINVQKPVDEKVEYLRRKCDKRYYDEQLQRIDLENKTIERKINTEDFNKEKGTGNMGSISSMKKTAKL